MNRDLLNEIHRIQQKRLSAPKQVDLPEHQPEMLYIGCIDARLDPVCDIGIPQGRALIYRNIGALVPENPPAGTGGTNPESVSIGATIEFFLRHLPKLPRGQVKRIVISGHTHCGGIGYACAHAHQPPPQDAFLPRYLSLLSGAREKIFGGKKPVAEDQEEKAHRLEEESVRQSVANLLTYPLVKEKLAAGEIELCGWVLDTATKHIREIPVIRKGFTGDIGSLRFKDMTEQPQAGHQL